MPTWLFVLAIASMVHNVLTSVSFANMAQKYFTNRQKQTEQLNSIYTKRSKEKMELK